MLDSDYVGADIDPNGGVDGGDLAAFFAAFDAGEQTADLNKDGGIDGGDLAVFFEWFEAGFMGDHDLNDQRFLYRGYWWDDKLEMYHVRNRVYDPRRMIWLQRDPLGQLAGPDEYAYVMGEPRDYYDPMGLDKWWISDPFYYVGADAIGEYVNDFVDGGASLFDKNDAAHQGAVDGWMMTRDNLTFGLVDSWNDEANQIRAENDGGWMYTVGNGSSVIAREAIIAALTMGTGNLAAKGSQGALYLTRALQAYDIVQAGTNIGQGIRSIANGNYLEGTIQIASGVLGVVGAKGAEDAIAAGKAAKAAEEAKAAAKAAAAPTTGNGCSTTPAAPKGMRGRVLSAVEQAEFDAFAARARAQGLIENPHRTGSWGIMENGRYVEKVRIDVAEAGKPGFRGKTHIHIEGQPGHLDPSTKIPGEP